MGSLLSIFRMHWDHEPGRDALPRVRLPLLPLPLGGEGWGEGAVFASLRKLVGAEGLEPPTYSV